MEMTGSGFISLAEGPENRAALTAEIDGDVAVARSFALLGQDHARPHPKANSRTLSTAASVSGVARSYDPGGKSDNGIYAVTRLRLGRSQLQMFADTGKLRSKTNLSPLRPGSHDTVGYRPALAAP